MLATVFEAMMPLGWWETSSEGREERRRLRDPVLREARIQKLEPELGFGAYDEIGAITALVAATRTAEADRWYHARKRPAQSAPDA